MDELAQAKEEIRNGNYTSAETVLGGILDRAEGITSHLLFDLVSAYDDLFSVTGRYEQLISVSQHCAEQARHLAGIDGEIHSAHILLVVAGAEKALGRKYEAARSAAMAERILARFSAERFSVGSRVRVNSMRVRLKSLQTALNEHAPAPPSKTQSANSNSNTNGGPEGWKAFASRKNLSARDVKACLTMMKRSVGPAESLTIILDWAAQTPRAGSVGASAESFAVLIEELTSITASHAILFESQRKLFEVLHEWEQEQHPWLQRLIQTNRKAGLTEHLQRLRRAMEATVQHSLNSRQKRLAELEGLDSGAIPDGGTGQDHEVILLRLDSDLEELLSFVPAPLSARVTSMRNRVASLITRVDQELCRRNEICTQMLEAIAQASNQSALADLRTIAERQLPPTMLVRAELQQAFRHAENRLLLGELEAMETRERAAHLARLDSVRGVDLANLLFREYGIDLAMARKLVIDRNHGDINLDGVLDRVLEIRRQKQQPQTE
jgi:hypothetical protein